MAAVTITTDDLAPFADIEQAKADAMIEDALARAALIAPCILDDDFTQTAAAKAIIRGAILRWNDAGTGGIVQQTVGPFSETVDTSQSRRSLFWPSEIVELQRLCASSPDGAFTIDTAPKLGNGHSLICSINFGADYCSCGADLAGEPIFGDPYDA